MYHFVFVLGFPRIRLFNRFNTCTLLSTTSFPPSHSPLQHIRFRRAVICGHVLHLFFLTGELPSSSHRRPPILLPGHPDSICPRSAAQSKDEGASTGYSDGKCIGQCVTGSIPCRAEHEQPAIVQRLLSSSRPSRRLLRMSDYGQHFCSGS